MRADRDEVPLNDERRGAYGIVAAVGGVVVVALLLYFGLRDPAEPPAAAPQQVIRDGALVAPAAVTPTPETPAAPPAAGNLADFNERQLAPPVPTVGAGAAAVLPEDADREALVIDGALLEELEEDAEATPPAPPTP